MFQTKVVEKIKKHVLCSITFFSENRAVCALMWKYIVERERPQMTIRCMRIGCWMPKATNAHSQAVQYLLLFHCNNGCTNAPKCYFIRILPVFFIGYNRPAFISIHLTAHNCTALSE